jgi:hypothetical protein
VLLGQVRVINYIVTPFIPVPSNCLSFIFVLNACQLLMPYQRVPLREEGDDEGLEEGFPTDNIVDFDGVDDVQNPKNWSSSEKTITTLFYSLCTLSSTWASAAYRLNLSMGYIRF